MLGGVATRELSHTMARARVVTRELSHLMGESTCWIWKPIQRFLKTVKIKLAYDPTPALDRYPKE